jgi:hypothetical protein
VMQPSLTTCSVSDLGLNFGELNSELRSWNSYTGHPSTSCCGINW